MFNILLGPVFFSLLMLSLGIGVSSSQFFTGWFSLELNMLTFLGMMVFIGEGGALSLKYFFVQSLASGVFLGSFLLSGEMGEGMTLVASLCLLMKLGAAPLHSWFVEVMAETSWGSLMALATLQKVIPLMLLSAWFKGFTFFVFIACLVAILGSMSQIQLKKILAYSSILSTGWLLAGSGSLVKALVFLGFYGVGLLAVVASIGGSGSPLMSESGTWVASLAQKMSLILAFVSMAGIPPFLGFYGKLLLLSHLYSSQEIFVAAILVQSSLWMLYLYVRVMGGAFLTRMSSSVGGFVFAEGGLGGVLVTAPALMGFVLLVEGVTCMSKFEFLGLMY